jgi:uncharacterized protein
VKSARPIDPALGERKLHLEAILRDLGSMVVAFSGGVDSTLLLRVVSGLPGLRYVALTTDSPTNTRIEVEEARAYARAFGARHLVIAVNELETPGYADNPANRCYLCKQTLYPLCLEVASKEGLAWVVDGVNTDDLGDYRPGLRAAEEIGVRHPLVEAGLSKADVRGLSAYFGLETADKPASPCLSSRFPYGTAISEERLRQVERAEAYLHELGFVELRVRHLGTGARVEVAAADVPRLANPTVRDRIRERLAHLGFDEIQISEKPLRSGSLNDALFVRNSRGST